MSTWLVLIVALGLFAQLAGCWLGWQLLRQNGSLLLRLEELEKRLNELEFGNTDGSPGLPLGSEAPAFELPDLVGERKSLAQFRGQPVLMVFFNPDSGFCREMMPKLATIQNPESGGRKSDVEPLPLPLIITTGDAEKNRRFFAEPKVGCPALLQNNGEVAKAYQVNGTPAGYLVSADGKIASEVAIRTEALLGLAAGKSEIRNPKSETDPSALAEAADGGNGRAGRFGNRSLARSKIKHDGLKAGTPAPDFRLPRLDGRGELSLEEMRGRRVLLVFSSPDCGPCNALAPELERFYRTTLASPSMNLALAPSPRPSPPLRERVADRQGEGEIPGLAVVMISKGEPKENCAKVKEHGLTIPVVLQQQWEISRRYAMFATPVAYLIDEQGVITHDVAVGTDAILELLAEAGRMVERTHEVAVA